MTPLLLLQVFATFAMTGVIWMVQVVHYPLLSKVSSETFGAYHQGHTTLITFVVLPLMVAEAGTALQTALAPFPPFRATEAWVGLGLVVAIWASTFLLQVPRHEALAKGFDADAHTFLVTSNWIRTVAWTARSAMLGWLLLRATPA